MIPRSRLEVSASVFVVPKIVSTVSDSDEWVDRRGMTRWKIGIFEPDAEFGLRRSRWRQDLIQRAWSGS